MEKDVLTGHKTVNKLWNAGKFILMNLETYPGNAPDKLELSDRWILAKYAKVVSSVTDSFEKYDYAKGKQELERFFWNDFCDNYLELVKKRLYEPPSADAQHSAQYALRTVFVGILQMYAPILPFITERLYGFFEDESIHASTWPEFSFDDNDALLVGRKHILPIMQIVRKYKSDNQLSMNADLSSLSVSGHILLEEADFDLKAVTRAEKIAYSEAGEISVDIHQA